MNALEFLAEWAVRSSVLIAAGALVLMALRVKDSSIRLAVWVALLFGSLIMPAIPLMTMTVALPRIPVIVARPVGGPVVDFASAPVVPLAAPVTPFDWARAGLILYSAISVGLLLRVLVGIVMSRRLMRESRATEKAGIRESEQVRAPVTLGIFRPAIVLPVDWHEWDAAKLDAVLAHERSHVARFDPAVQVLSAVHRAVLWFSPASWFLHSLIVRVAEEASDDAAMAVTRDRASYAGILLEFMQRGVCGAGLPMARYGRMDMRIKRVLDGKVLSRGLTWRGVAALVALGSPVAYVAAMASPQNAPAPVAPKPVVVAQAPAQPVAGRGGVAVKVPQRNVGYLMGLGNVSAATVTVSSRVEGQLMSVSFKEGQAVQAGQEIAIVESALMKQQLAQVQSELARDKDNREREADEERLDQANSLIESEGEITAPIGGVAGLRMLEPGNMIHPGEGIVTIAQMQPIAVLFTLPQDFLARVRSWMGGGAGPTVEAWNRDNSVKLATGHLTAIDNQIDEQTGTAKLKATFDNKDSALFPNQFVNVRLLVQ